MNSIFQLQPLELALNSPYLKRPFLTFGITIFVTAVITIFAWHALQPQAKTTQQPKISFDVKHPYEPYYKALASPAPALQIKELISIIEQLYKITGWQTTALTYKNNEYIAKLIPTTSNEKVSVVREWAAQNKAAFEETTSGVTLHFTSYLTNRKKPLFIYNLNKLISTFTEKLNLIVPHENIAISETTFYGRTKSANIIVNFNNFSPDFLVLLGNNLEQFPIKVTTIEIKSLQNLFSGAIQLTIWGQ